MNRRLFLYFMYSFIVKSGFEPQLGVLPPSSRPFVKNFLSWIDSSSWIDSYQETRFKRRSLSPWIDSFYWIDSSPFLWSLLFNLLFLIESIPLIRKVFEECLNRIGPSPFHWSLLILWVSIQSRGVSWSIELLSRIDDASSCFSRGLSLYESSRVQPLGDIDDAFESLRPWLVSESKPLWPILIILILKGSSIESIWSSLST